MWELYNLFEYLCNTSGYESFQLCCEIKTQIKITIMPVLTIVIVLIVAGVLLWLVNTYIPMQRTIKNILNAVIVIIIVIWLLKVFGLLNGLQNLRI